MKEEENKGKEYREREGERGDKKRKGNAFIVHLITGHEGPEGEQRYRCTLSLTPVLDGVGGQSHAQAALRPGKRHRTHFVRGLVDPSAGPDGFGKSRLHRDSIPDLPVRIVSLYRLRHPGPRNT